MSGKNPRMTPLEMRKQLLIAESEINRAQLAQDWVAIRGGIRTFAERAKSIMSIASSVAVLVAGLAAWRRGKSAAAAAKPSWVQTILNGVGLISSLWLAFRPPGGDDATQ